MIIYTISNPINITAMKRKLLIPLLLLIAGITMSQVPQGFSYQSVARNAMGNPIAGSVLSVKIGITSDAAGAVYVWEEQHSVTTNDVGLFTLVVGDQAATRIQGSALTFQSINWAASPLYIKTTIQYQGNWHTMGASQLWSVPYSMVSAKSSDFAGTFTFDGDTIVIMQPLSIGSTDAGRALLAVTSLDDTSDDPLFEVKRKDGQTVFAVYNDAVNIYVPSAPGKGSASKGGFAIGSFDEAKKGASQDFFRVTPDSVRIYINDNPNFTKAAASKGGFAIGSFDEAKGIKNTYFNLTAAASVDTVGSRAQLLWYPKKEALLAGRVHIGAPDSVGQNSTALGYHSIAMGNWSQAFGYKAKAIGTYSTAIGNNALARGNDSYALGSGAEATGIRSFALGSVGVDESGVPTGRKTIASGPYSVAIGMGAQATTQSAAMALGTNSTASGFASTSIGYSSEATSHYAVAIGYYSKATQYYTHAFGLRAEATATGSLALGMYSKARGFYSSSLGYSSDASHEYAVAVGFQAKAYNNYATAIGYQANASNTYSVALGYQAKSTASNSFSFGNNSEAAGENSFAIGTFGLNPDGTVNTARPTKTFLSYSVALGMGAQSTKKGALSMGVNSTSSGDYSTSIGYGPTASANYSTALGVNANSSGVYATAMGYGASSEADYAIALGMSATSSGLYSTALGYRSRAYGNKSLAIGSHYSFTYMRLMLNRLTGQVTWVPYTVNRYNTATRDYSIAIGNGNTAEDGGMAIGSNNYALSMGSVALGHSNTADTSYAFAAGFSNLANGYNAFAMGENLTAQSTNSFVVGTYNVITGNKYEWIDTDPLFVVGNGESGTPHDAFRVNKNGGVYIYPENSQMGLYLYDLNTTRTSTTYGIRSYINSTTTAYIYSGFFTGYSSTADRYLGLYADQRSGASIDVAEYIYDTYGNTEAADVVVADPNKTESVIKSSTPYQTSVLGVISTKPHLTLGMELVINEVTGEPIEGVLATRLALTGRVPVKVTTENGPIKPGDLLTTSSTPGHAMKWSLIDVNSATSFEEMKTILSENERRRNAIIGKAVESHSSGTGKIIVLVSLQ